MKVDTRAAAPEDAPAIAALLLQLGHPISADSVQNQLAVLARTGCDHVLVAEAEGAIHGVLSLHWTPLLHRDKPLGRVITLVVDASVRGQGVGTRLMAEAEAILRDAGCSAVEVTSNVRRTEAHEFYQGLGYGQPSAYFRRSLDG